MERHEKGLLSLSLPGVCIVRVEACGAILISLEKPPTPLFLVIIHSLWSVHSLRALLLSTQALLTRGFEGGGASHPHTATTASHPLGPWTLSVLHSPSFRCAQSAMSTTSRSILQWLFSSKGHWKLGATKSL